MTDHATIERELIVDGEHCRIHATRNDRFFGHALDVRLSRHDSTHLNTLSFACHPEHENFEKYQAMSTEELISIAVLRLESGCHNSALKKCRTDGMVLLLRFNDR